jgi:hypothetical protein
VPGDRLALAVRVSREIQRFRLAEGARDRREVALVLLEHLVLHRVVLVRVDRAFLGHQIAHMAVGGEHVELPTQVFFYGPCLGGGFDDDEVVCHDLPKKCSILKQKTADEPRTTLNHCLCPPLSAAH